MYSDAILSKDVNLFVVGTSKSGMSSHLTGLELVDAIGDELNGERVSHLEGCLPCTERFLAIKLDVDRFRQEERAELARYAPARRALASRRFVWPYRLAWAGFVAALVVFALQLRRTDRPATSPVRIHVQVTKPLVLEIVPRPVPTVVAVAARPTAARTSSSDPDETSELGAIDDGEPLPDTPESAPAE